MALLAIHTDSPNLCSRQGHAHRHAHSHTCTPSLTHTAVTATSILPCGHVLLTLIQVFLLHSRWDTHKAHTAPAHAHTHSSP